MSLLTFQLNYHTAWGQQVCLCGSIPELGSFDEDKAVVLSNNGDVWFAELNVWHHTTSPIEYYYFIREGYTNVCREWGRNRKLYIAGEQEFLVQDLWKNQPYHTYLYSSVFTESIFVHEKKPFEAAYYSQSILLNVVCPYVERTQLLVISGESSILGNWDLQHALPLSYVDDGEWQVLLDADDFPDETSYKFVIVDKDSREAIHWEDDGNRILYAGKAKRRNCVLVEMALQFHYHHFSYKGTGTAIPVFSLRSDSSFGIGDFLDLKKMVEWAAVTGQQMIQVLPVNDTTTTGTWKDSYPYSAISIYALHPIYLGYKDFPLNDRVKFTAYLQEAEDLNRLPEMDYEKVLKLKTDYSRDLFLQDGEQVLLSDEYGCFYEKNELWLFPYGCYCYLRDRYNTANFKDWGEFAVYDEARLKRMLEMNSGAKKETEYYCYLQFLLYRQLSDVKEYAHQKGMALKGDIPIGINRDSVDAWTNPELFNMDTQTGAPPDDFSVFGQNWGFPTYNWYAMEKERYSWWKNRFRKMADYFDAYRIDHILGFFRIWEIPPEAVQGLLGYFSPALPYWAEEIVRAGIPFDEGRMVNPFIHEHFLPDLFGEYTEEVKTTYLDVSGWQQFKLRSFCNTQQKIKHLFEGKDDEKNKRIYSGLLSLCAEVLFIRDRYCQNRFHPRITAQYTCSYRYLDDNVKDAFNRLYDDFYYRRHNYFWREQAMKKLPRLISSTSMMVCGEDLGMVPECVPSVMNELQILSLEIQRMPKDPNVTFANLHTLPYLSVCTTSTHDMSPVRLWWLENRVLTQRYYNENLHHDGEAPDECSAELCREILEAHLRSSAMWVILPWQDWISVDDMLRRENPEEERINVPANSEHYWRYRMHISLDDLMKQDRFNEKIRQMNRR